MHGICHTYTRFSSDASGIVTRASGMKSGFLVHTCMYWSVPSLAVTYRDWYVMLKMVHTSVYWYVLSMYRYCIMTCMIAMKSGTVLVFKHHHVPVLYTQYHFLSVLKSHFNPACSFVLNSC